MKNIFKFVTLLLCLTLLSLLVSCDIDIHHHVNESKILGTWACTYYHIHYSVHMDPYYFECHYEGVDREEEFDNEPLYGNVLFFKEDGTYSGNFFDCEGYWSVVDDTLILEGRELTYYSTPSWINKVKFHIDEISKQRLKLSYSVCSYNNPEYRESEDGIIHFQKQ